MIYTLYRNAIKEVVTVVKSKDYYGIKQMELIFNECDAALDRAVVRYIAKTQVVDINIMDIKDKYYDFLLNSVVNRV